MDDSQKNSFGVAIAAMLETFGQQATKPILHGYWLGLSDLSLDSVQVAIALAIRTCQFTPKPVELRRLAGEQTNEQRAIDAWGDVMRSIGLGSWKHVDFGDKLINATIRNLGGWPSFLSKFDGDKQQEFARVNFIKTYQAFAAGGVDGEACKPLPGLSEATAVGGKQRAPIVHRIECSPDRMKLPAPMRQTALEATRAVPALTLKRVD